MRRNNVRNLKMTTMNRKIIILAMAAMLAVPVSISAQSDTPQQRMMRKPGGNIEMMTQQLNLTDEQKEKLEKVFEDMKPGENKEDMEKNREEMDKKIKEILSDEQYEKFTEMQKNRGKRGQQPMKREKLDE